MVESSSQVGVKWAVGDGRWAVRRRRARERERERERERKKKPPEEARCGQCFRGTL